jgi:hypothetical protein
MIWKEMMLVSYMIQPRLSLGEIEENHEHAQSVYSVVARRFEPGTLGIQTDTPIFAIYLLLQI